MRTVQDLIKNKGGEGVWTISPGATVYEAIQLMANKNIGALLVKDGRDVVGIITERDYTRKIVLLGRSSATTPVSEVMTRNVVYVEPTETVENCMALMTYSRFRHLPVIQGRKLIGLISIGDVVKAMIDDKEFIIDELVKYVTGRPLLTTSV